MLFVIFHGAFGNPDSNWFPDLKERLEGLGQKVLIPSFPVEDWDTITKDGKNTIIKNQTLSNWTADFEKYIPQIKKEKKVCFVGHSLGPLFILHVVAQYKIKLDSAIFVSPFLNKLGQQWQIDLVNKTFYKNDFDWNTLKKLIPLSYVLYSDNDPYVPSDYSLEFAQKLNSSSIVVQKAAHMNAAVNLNEFPLVSELCKSRIDLTLYQRYLEHRRELFAVPYTTGATEEMIYLDPDEVQYEGIFHFRNLRKEGFATFYTGTTFWDSQSKYMMEARKAAKRVKHFKRVFIVDSASHLNRPAMREQIRLDFEAGIEVFLCRKDDIQGIVSKTNSDFWHLDFGLWDDDYVCFVPMDDHARVHQVRLSSRKKDLETAREWKKLILKKAFRINTIETDIKFFLQQLK